MQTAVFIFTHLIMIGAIVSVFYIGFRLEPEEAEAYPTSPIVQVPTGLNKFKAFGCIMKTRAAFFSSYVSRVKFPGRSIRRSGHTI